MGKIENRMSVADKRITECLENRGNGLQEAFSLQVAQLGSFNISYTSHSRFVPT